MDRPQHLPFPLDRPVGGISFSTKFFLFQQPFLPNERDFISVQIYNKKTEVVQFQEEKYN